LSSLVTFEEVRDGAPPGQLDKLRRQQESLLRRIEDRRLVEDLARRHFAGARYLQFETELGRYGLSVMRAWLYTGRAFGLSAGRGYALHPTEGELDTLRRDSDARKEIAITTVGKALPRFRQQALVEGGWRFEGGASIPTYFMGAALSDFPNEFRRWRSQRNRWRQQDHGDETTNALHRQQASDDPAVLALGNIRVKEDLERISPRAKEIVLLTMDGYHQDEIMEILGEASVRAVEGVLHRWRTEEKKRLCKGGDDSGSA